MPPALELPGLERLMEVCQRLGLRLTTSPPRSSPFKAGTRIAGLPLDPMLAAVYSRLGYAAFATDVAGIVLYHSNDEEQELEEDNERWLEDYRQQLALPTLIFAGEPAMAYRYATVPSLANEQGHQPVVRVDVYEDPYAHPIASDVNHFFRIYSYYLETLMQLPDAREEAGLLTFPWEVPEIIGRDSRLVEMLQAGRFDSLMSNTEIQGWAREVVEAGLAKA